MKRLHKGFACLVVFLAATAATAQPIKTEDQRNSPAVLKAFRDVIAKPSASVVRVQCDGKDAALGTVVGADGWILTKYSELNGPVVCKFKDGKSYPGKVVGVHIEYDLALLKIDAKSLTPVYWRDSQEAKVGKWVASVGIDKDPVAVGVISVGTRSFKGGDQPPKTLNTNSGWLGVGLEDASGVGVKITAVQPKSPADKAGVRANDIVLQAAGKVILDTESLINTIQRHKPKDVVLLKIRRGDDERDVAVTLEPLPKGLGVNPQELMGSVLSKRRGGFPTILQHDTVLKPTDCGGPLVDLDGMTIGINLARAGRTESYAAPSEDVIPLLAALKSGDLAPKVDVTKPDVLPIAPAKTSEIVLRSKHKLTLGDKVKDERHYKTEDVKLYVGGKYVIELASPDFPVQVVVADAKGNKLADKEAAAGTPAQIEFAPKSDGDYRITITTTQEGAVGAYTLTVRQTTAPPPAKEEKKGKKKFGQ